MLKLTSVRNVLLIDISVADMISQHFWNAHPHLAWAMWGLDEIEATIASIESRLHGRTGVHPITESTVVDMRRARDAFRKFIDAGANDAAPVHLRADLEDHWAAFEHSLLTYLDTVGRQLREQETIFRARADAQSSALRQTVNRLRENAQHFAADKRGDVEMAVEHLGSAAGAAEIKLDELNAAEGVSWIAMRSALAETRAALDQAYRSAVDAVERSALNHTVR